MNRNAEPIHSAGVVKNLRTAGSLKSLKTAGASKTLKIDGLDEKVGIPGTSRYRRTQVINEGGTADDSPFAMRMHGKGIFFMQKNPRKQKQWRNQKPIFKTEFKN